MRVSFKVAACQPPEILEDVDQAFIWIEEYAAQAETANARLLCFPECFLQGYLVREEPARRGAIDLSSEVFQAILERLARYKPVLIFGMIEIEDGVLYNTAVVIERGRLVGRYRKVRLLAGERIFRPGDRCPVFEIDGFRFGINICYDTQFPEMAAMVQAQGARLIVCPENNMMRRENAESWKDRHHEMRSLRAKETGLWLISSDVTGSRGDSIALGPTSVIDPEGSVVVQVPLREVDGCDGDYVVG